MRDIITIIAAGALMITYALIAPSIVEAVQSPPPGLRKALVQRLSQADGEVPVSVVSGPLVSHTMAGAGRALPYFAR